jgi:hypothetical protein
MGFFASLRMTARIPGYTQCRILRCAGGLRYSTPANVERRGASVGVAPRTAPLKQKKLEWATSDLCIRSGSYWKPDRNA